MIKAYIKEDYLIFYINGNVKLNNELLSQVNLLKQICSCYGKTISIGPMMALQPQETLKGRERQLLQTIIAEFQLLWGEYEEIQRKINNATAESLNISSEPQAG